jgi:hypothetical protein
MIPELDANQVQVRRIVQSKAFKGSEVHRNLLNYLAEKSLAGEAHALKEYTVGLDVFGKPPSYDPRQESVVRMHAGRLRQKLVEYYRSEGKDDPVVVDLPKGGFVLTFEPRTAPVAAPPPAVAGPESKPIFSKRGELALVAALFVALASAAYFGVRYLRAEGRRPAAATVPSWTPELQDLWAPLLSSDRPLMVTLATGPFRGSNGAVASDAAVGTANAAFVLGQFLGQRKHNVFPIRSDVLSMGEIAMGDVIWVGPTAGKPQIRDIPPVDQPFELVADGIRNHKPAAGEAEFFADAPPKGSQESEISHALISHLPGLYGNGAFLYLSGNRVASVMGAVQALTDPDLARDLVGHLRKPDGTLPKYYQVVLKVKAMDDTPVDITYILHRELSLGKSPLAARGR